VALIELRSLPRAVASIERGAKGIVQLGVGLPADPVAQAHRLVQLRIAGLSRGVRLERADGRGPALARVPALWAQLLKGEGVAFADPTFRAAGLPRARSEAVAPVRSDPRSTPPPSRPAARRGRPAALRRCRRGSGAPAAGGRTGPGPRVRGRRPPARGFAGRSSGGLPAARRRGPPACPRQARRPGKARWGRPAEARRNPRRCTRGRSDPPPHPDTAPEATQGQSAVRAAPRPDRPERTGRLAPGPHPG
jgi:hypothetical protein